MFYNSANEFNDCVSHGACSVSPDVSSMNELMFTILCQISYYVINLKKLDITKENIIKDIIYLLAFSDSLKDLSKSQILGIFSAQYANLIHIKRKYCSLCKKNNIEIHNLKNVVKLSADANISDLLKLGEREFLNKYKNTTEEKKYYAEILINVMKSVAVNLINLAEYTSEDNFRIVDNILAALNIFNSKRISFSKIKQNIDTLAESDLILLREITKYRTEKFGQISKTEVSTSTVQNKAIMVSGSNLNDLYSLLNEPKTKDIDIYTNGNMIIAHAYPYFRQFKNLKGHFGNAIAYTMLDFATFPGAILLTKNESQNIEYLYRGRLFTTDKITPKGVAKLNEDDFSPLIESALQAKGFAKGQKRESKIIGYNLDELNESIDNLISKNPEKIIIIGYSDLKNDDLSYFKELFSNLPDNVAIISFAYNPDKKNCLYINLGNDYALLYEFLEKIFAKISISSQNLYFILTKCDINTLSNIINLKNKGAKNIYLSDCPSVAINPAVLKIFKNYYDIKSSKNIKI